MSTVDELLDRLARIGATIRPAGDRLILRAGSAAVPAELVRRIRQAKVELLAAVSAHDNERRYWHERFTALTFAWGAGKRDWESARRLAWGDLQNEWHKKHGRRWPTWLCAGCEKPVGGLESIYLKISKKSSRDPKAPSEERVIFITRTAAQNSRRLHGPGPCQGRGNSSGQDVEQALYERLFRSSGRSRVCSLLPIALASPVRWQILVLILATAQRANALVAQRPPESGSRSRAHRLAWWPLPIPPGGPQRVLTLPKFAHGQLLA
jgi:hypothetical protein